MDVVDKATRSRMMAGIRDRNTKPEIIVRSLLHRRGFRFRLHVRDLRGNPDIVLPRYHAVIFIHGCFWHGHDCPLFKWPKTRADFWQKKINRNKENDFTSRTELCASGWRVLVVWECAIKGAKKDVEGVAQNISDWLGSESPFMEIRG